MPEAGIIIMTEQDIIFKFYKQGERPNPDCFCHYGWEGTEAFAFWKYARSYYESAIVLYERFTQSKGDFAVLDGIGLTLCFLYRHFVELTVKYLYFKFVVKGDEAQYRKFLKNGHGLNKLWIETRAIIKHLKDRVGSKVSLSCLDHYILEVDKFDQNEEAMRYPVKNNLKPMHEPTRLDIFNLHDRMAELFDAFDKLDHDIENQLFADVRQDKIDSFLRKYNEMRPRLLWFLEMMAQAGLRVGESVVEDVV